MTNRYRRARRYAARRHLPSGMKDRRPDPRYLDDPQEAPRGPGETPRPSPTPGTSPGRGSEDEMSKKRRRNLPSGMMLRSEETFRAHGIRRKLDDEHDHGVVGKE